MPDASEISTAASAYRQNGALLAKICEGLTPEQWLTRPNQTTNPALWIVGHAVWARAMALKALGLPWERPWLPLFARGAKLPEPSQFPPPEEIMHGWQDVSASLTAALEGASDEVLSAPAGEKSPSFDGKISGLVSFLAFHEAYHVGQAAYLRCWLGQGGVVG